MENQCIKAFEIAKDAVKLAYIFERMAADSECIANPTVEKAMREIADSLSKVHATLQAELRPIMHVSGAMGLASILKKRNAGEINEDVARAEAWWLISDSGDTSEVAPEFKLPDREQISESGGPVEAAFEMWSDLKPNAPSSRSLFDQRRKRIANGSRPLVSELYSIARERHRYIATVLEGILELTIEEREALSDALMLEVNESSGSSQRCP